MSVWDNLNKLKDALDGSANDAHTKPDSSHASSERHDTDDWKDKLRDVIDGDGDRKKHEEEEKVAIARNREEAKRLAEEERGFGDKIHDLADGGAHRKAKEEEIFQRLEKERRDKHGNEGWSSKLKEVIDGGSEHEKKVEDLHQKVREETKEKEKQGDGGALEDWKHKVGAVLGSHGTTPPAEAKPVGWSDKVKDILDGSSDAEKRVEEQHKQKRDETKHKEAEDGLIDKIQERLHGTPKEEPKKQNWLESKVNELAGGGAKSEAKEDKLDKTVDFVQEHILHQGDQSNESAIEQAKDETISDAIRQGFKSVTGHEFIVKDKEH